MCPSLQNTRETNTSFTREDDVVQKIIIKKLVQWFMEAGGKVHFTPAHKHYHTHTQCEESLINVLMTVGPVVS